MALRLAKRRSRRLSMTSLIDVIFLLLLFFMLSSTFSRYGSVDLMAAEAGQAAAATTQQRPVFLKIGLDQLSLNGDVLALADLASRLTSFAPEQESGGVQVLLNLEPDVTSQRLVDVLAVLRRHAAFSVTVLG